MSKTHEISDSDSDIDKQESLVKNKSMHEISDSDEEEGNQMSRKQLLQTSKRNSFHELSDSEEDVKPSVSSQASNLVKSKSLKRKSSETLSPDSKKLKREDRRPLCKYGTKCYRKNPSHYSAFKHPEEQGHEEDKTKNPTKRGSISPTSQEVNLAFDPAEVLGSSNPFRFLLTKVSGIENKFNRKAVNMKDILSPHFGKLEKSVQFNYCIDIPWLVSQYPTEFKNCPLLVVHGMHKEEKKGLENDAKPYSNVSLCAAPMDIPFGTHHTKMMILKYAEGLRVVILTANLIERDWFQKTQGVWISPLCKPLSKEKPDSEGESSTNFRQDLIDYLTAYKCRPLLEWVNIMKRHDMSSVNVYLIASIPGRHTGENKAKWGHMRLRKLLVSHGPDAKLIHKWPVVGQFSSVGSLGASKQNWVCGEWLSSITACKNLVGGIQAQANPLHLIFPSKDNIRLSLEGYAAGGSVPYSIKTAKKQTWFHDFLHQWKADVEGRTAASPHIKTFCRASPDWTQLAWFLVTSANMSKAAWGTLEKGGIQLMIRSYELGVLYLPNHPSFGNQKVFGVTGKESDEAYKFPVPIDLPPTPYVKGKDRPWIWDIPYVDKPDTHGTKWCPP